MEVNVLPSPGRALVTRTIRFCAFPARIALEITCRFNARNSSTGRENPLEGRTMPCAARLVGLSLACCSDLADAGADGAGTSDRGKRTGGPDDTAGLLATTGRCCRRAAARRIKSGACSVISPSASCDPPGKEKQARIDNQKR